jgi:hypothetical protein
LIKQINFLLQKYPVIIVGSVLYKNNPRDIDIICVIPDSSFKKFFGIGANKWIKEGKTGAWSKERFRWSDISIKTSKTLSKRMKNNVDFKFVPKSAYDD